MEDAVAAKQPPQLQQPARKYEVVVRTHKVADCLTGGRWSTNNTWMYLIKR